MKNKTNNKTGSPNTCACCAGQVSEQQARRQSREKPAKPVVKIATGTVLFATGLALGIPAVSRFFADAGLAGLSGSLPGLAWIRPAFFVAAWLLIGGEVILRAIKNIFRGKVFDENFLMTTATIGAFAIGEFPEGAAVMLFFQIGEIFQEMAIRRSRSSITSLMDLRPDYAMLRKDGKTVRVDPETVLPGDIIVVKPGEKIALDGVIAEGSSFLDTAALTGESLPREVNPGSEVLSGMINRSSLIAVRVSREFGESAASRILKLVREAEEKKAPVEKFITRFARYYTPVVVFSAAALAIIPPLVIVSAGGFAGAGTFDPESFGTVAPGAAAVFSEWLHRALVFLVVSCPCALVVSIPLSFFGGIGGASRRGILVKGGNYLDALNRVEAVVFDKTGTLTRGFFTVAAILPAEGRSAEDVLRLAALAESNSNHPIAASIKREAAARGFSIDGDKTVSYSEIAGRGVRLQMEGKSIRAGSRALLEEEGIACPETVTVNGTAADSGSGTPDSAKDGTPGSAKDGTLVYVAEDGRYAGVLVIADELKKDSPETIASLKKAGIKTVMFTGDSKAAAEAISKKAGIDEYYAELLPWEKVDKLEELEATTGVHGRGGSGAAVSKTNRRPGNIVFVGDGINDAPVLARSGVGIAMGGLGSDAAIESADIVLMTDEPGKIIEAIDVARQTRNIVRQNIVFSLGVKAVLLVLGALGIASLWAAVFGDVGVALIAVLNAARAYGGKAA